MASQDTILAPFINGVQTIAERFIQIAQYDKTVSAEIILQDPETPTSYYVSTSGYARLKVHTLENDTTKYREGDNVFISIPGGDFNSNDKVIIGKVRTSEQAYYLRDLREILAVQDTDVYADRDNTIAGITNEERFTTLVIEFETKVKLFYNNKEITAKQLAELNLSRSLLLKEIVIPFELSYGKSNDQVQRNLWSSRNLYGNIFNQELNVPHLQRIILTGLENLENPTINWIDYNKRVPVLTFDNIEIKGLEAELTRSNTNYYYGYTSEDLENKSLFDVALHATLNGYFLFLRKGFFNSTLSTEEQQEWDPNPITLKDLPREYNWRIEQYNESYVSQQNLDTLLGLFSGLVSKEDLGLLKQELENKFTLPNNYVKDGYVLDKIETTTLKIDEAFAHYIEDINASVDNNKNNKIVYLIAWPLWEEETEKNHQVIYDIIERKET